MQGITATTLEARNVYPKFSFNDEGKEFTLFLNELKAAAKLVMQRLGKDFEFIVDEQNKYVISQLWYFITNSPKFKGNLQKGIFLSGDVGTGKTILMLSFMYVMRKATKRNFAVTFPETIHDTLTAKGMDFYRLRTLLIDDICREPDKVKGYFGENPVKLLTMYRYNYPNQSYCTGNFAVFDKAGNVKPDNEIVKRYGVMIFDRIWESYNFIELTGESRRV